MPQYGRTPLWIASSKVIVELLLKKGAKVDLEDWDTLMAEMKKSGAHVILEDKADRWCLTVCTTNPSEFIKFLQSFKPTTPENWGNTLKIFERSGDGVADETWRSRTFPGNTPVHYSVDYPAPTTPKMGAGNALHALWRDLPLNEPRIYGGLTKAKCTGSFFSIKVFKEKSTFELMTSSDNAGRFCHMLTLAAEMLRVLLKLKQPLQVTRTTCMIKVKFPMPKHSYNSDDIKEKLKELKQPGDGSKIEVLEIKNLWEQTATTNISVQVDPKDDSSRYSVAMHMEAKNPDICIHIEVPKYLAYMQPIMPRDEVKEDLVTVVDELKAIAKDCVKVSDDSSSSGGE